VEVRGQFHASAASPAAPTELETEWTQRWRQKIPSLNLPGIETQSSSPQFNHYINWATTARRFMYISFHTFLTSILDGEECQLGVPTTFTTVETVMCTKLIEWCRLQSNFGCNGKTRIPRVSKENQIRSILSKACLPCPIVMWRYCEIILSSMRRNGKKFVRHVQSLRGPFAKFVDSPYYSESELCGGAVTVSFSKYLPW
jgi:hypothetical protein